MNGQILFSEKKIIIIIRKQYFKMSSAGNFTQHAERLILLYIIQNIDSENQYAHPRNLSLLIDLK